MIELQNVNKWYGSYHALVDVSETIHKGEVVVVSPRARASPR